MAAFLTPEPAIESAVRAKGEQLFTLMDRQPAPALFSRKGAYARLMNWSMQDPVFKTQLFRFVDVLPSLDSPAEIVRHLQEYLGDRAVELNPALKAGLAASSFAPALVAGPVKARIVDLAGQLHLLEVGDADRDHRHGLCGAGGEQQAGQGKPREPADPGSAATPPRSRSGICSRGRRPRSGLFPKTGVDDPCYNNLGGAG